MADKRFGREEIESHSSALTNKRIDGLLTLVDSAAISAQVAVPPTRYHAIDYHSTLMALYLETSSAYSQQKVPGIKDTIEACIKKGQFYAFQFKYADQNKLPQFNIELSIQNSMKLQHAMHTALQNLKYFFRFGQHDPKGLKETLKLFEQGGQNVEKQISEQIGTVQGEAEKKP